MGSLRRWLAEELDWQREQLRTVYGRLACRVGLHAYRRQSLRTLASWAPVLKPEQARCYRYECPRPWRFYR